MERPPPLTYTVSPPKQGRRLSWASDHEKKTKVCLVCRCHSSSVVFFDIFVLDLLSDKDRIPGDGASEDFKPRKPTFRLAEGSFPAEAFCVVGSTLYMFQGFPHGNSVAAFDLLPSNDDDSKTVELLPSMLSISPDVLHPKTYPAAVPIGDDENGKILVFSNFIKPGCVDFELYDPRTRCVEQLPGLPPQKTGFRALGHTFDKESSTFYLETGIGLFSLDLSVRGAEWVRRFGPAPFRLASRACCVNLGNDVRGSGDFYFCVVRGGGVDTGPCPRLAISFCQWNVNKLREDNKREITKRETITSFKFLLNADVYCTFRPFALFPLPDIVPSIITT